MTFCWTLKGVNAPAPVTSPTAVNEAIEALLGLRWEQFSRIIVLPQGEFRTLLLASAADQERLLKHLFGTERFDAVEARLRAMTTEAEAALGATRAGLGTLLQSAGVESLDALEAARTEAGLGFDAAGLGFPASYAGEFR